MEHFNTSDSNLHSDLSARSYQNFSPQTSCSLSTSGSTYSLSSSPASVSAYANSPVDLNIPHNNKRRPSMPAMQFNHYRTENSDGYLNSPMSEDQHNNDMSGARPVNRFFPDGVVDILNKWFYENQSYPYPDENMTNILAKEANISAKQVRKWFANKRVRSNKCYKQTFRIKKESLSQSKASINRRQTKSVSDSESINMSENQQLYYENEFVTGSPEMSDRKYFMWQENMANQTSSESSVSNSPSGFSYSPKNESQQNCFNQMPFDMSSSMSYSPDKTSHSTANSSPSSNNNALASLYNPYFLVNLLQNPSMALQAVIANRLISMNQTDSNSQMDQSFDLNNSMQSSQKIKRKTYLSNCFKNEKSLPFDNNLRFIQEAATPNQESSHAMSNLYDSLTNKHSTCSNNSMRSSVSLIDMPSSINTAFVYNSSQQQVPSKPAKKINFGDISSLI